MITEQFMQFGEKMRAQIGGDGKLHGYFLDSAARLHRTCKLFALFSAPLGKTLEIGPFYGYIPFLLKERAGSYEVWEGADPAVEPLRPVYDRHGIQFRLIDFFDIFGPSHEATFRLPADDDSFDTILCWETMEHFNFNPVPFVRELRRVLKPGGRVCVTVPNPASLPALCRLVLGRGELAVINSYYDFADYVSNGKRCFYGFHWREYMANELTRLFSGAGFDVVRSGTFTAFHGHNQTGGVGPLRMMERAAMRVFSVIFPRYGTNVWLEVRKNS